MEITTNIAYYAVPLLFATVALVQAWRILSK